MYEVVYDNESLEFLGKLERSVAKRIWEKVNTSKKNPKHYFERLVGREDFKLRIGDYRVIADIDDALMKIEVTHIGHRKNVYSHTKP